MFRAEAATPRTSPTNGQNPGPLLTYVPFQESPDGTYQYCPLQDQEIRLIKVYSCPSLCNPGQQLHHLSHMVIRKPPPRYEDGEMHISIQHSQISNCYLEYTALSYCWGDPNDRRTVFVHELGGENEVQVMSITASLYGALQRAQYATIHDLNVNEQTSISGLFWADAICIRQDWDRDEEEEDQFWSAEKAAQVKMMAQIYESAITCLVDLGDESVDSHLVHDFVLVMITAVNKAGKEGRLDRAQTLKPFELAFYGLPPSEDPRWRAWTNFLARAWFRRVWVVQEYFLSRPGAFIFGSRGESFPWNIFPLLARNLQLLGLSVWSRRHTNGMSVDKICDAGVSEVILRDHVLLAARKEHGKRPTLLDGLQIVATLEATDPRDKAYSLLGMCAPLNHDDPDLRIEYFNKVTADQVIFRFARYILRTSPNPVQVLYYCDGRSTQFPSWFPNWSNAQQPPMKQYRNGLQIYNAGGRFQGIFRFNSATNTIACEAAAFDEVLHVGPTYVGVDYDFLDWEKQSRSWLVRLHRNSFQQRGSLPKLYPTPTKIEDAYAKALFGDNPPEIIDTQRCSLYQRLIEIFDIARRGLDQDVGTPITTIFEDTASFEMWDTTWRACLNHCKAFLRRRRLCATRNGRLAIVPARARAGDQLLILKGAVMPFTMRSKSCSHGETRDARDFQLVGGSYVDGIMYGDALQDIDRGQQWVEIMIK